MLRLEAGQAVSLWDEMLPIEVRELPEDLRRIDALLGDPALLAPIRAHWDGEAEVSRRSAVSHGRPTIAMETYVRSMGVVKQRTGWGYETLVREVSDSLHLRRFCLIALSERVPDESTIRKLTRRLGHETVGSVIFSPATRCLIWPSRVCPHMNGVEVIPVSTALAGWLGLHRPREGQSARREPSDDGRFPDPPASRRSDLQYTGSEAPDGGQ